MDNNNFVRETHTHKKKTRLPFWFPPSSVKRKENHHQRQFKRKFFKSSV